MRFFRSCRLLETDEYSSVFGFRRALRGQCFLLHYGEWAATRESARLGLVIGKKFMRRAVGRNLIKRLAREAFRLRRASLPPRDLVLRLAVRLPKPDRAARRMLAAEIQSLLDKMTTLPAPRST
jgi:ribonuclease P protein component